MKKLWAPWRIDYILSPKPQGCIFCDKPKEDNDRENLILYRGKHNFIVMNFYPYNNGHLMIVPYRHTSDLKKLSSETMQEMMTLTAECSSILKSEINAEGFNIGMNLGKIGGAGIDEHVHMHIVPRWNGDTNFMPVVGNTKVISQGLMDLYDVIKPAFKKLNI